MRGGEGGQAWGGQAWGKVGVQLVYLCCKIDVTLRCNQKLRHARMPAVRRDEERRESNRVLPVYPRLRAWRR